MRNIMILFSLSLSRQHMLLTVLPGTEEQSSPDWIPSPIGSAVPTLPTRLSDSVAAAFALKETAVPRPALPLNLSFGEGLG